MTPSLTTGRDLMRAVMASDTAPLDVLVHDAERVVGVTLKTLALAALSQGVAIDLGNGYALVCTTQPSEALA
jgi:hypothetical protein